MMIWVSDAVNSLIYVSPEWSELTGQTQSEADGLGWITPIHPDDRECARSTCVMARTSLQPYTQQFRILQKSGKYICLSASATPSILPNENIFLGFYGTLSPLNCDPSNFVATGHVHAVRKPADILDDEPHDVIEALADHLLRARGTELAALPGLAAILDMALFEVGHRLAHPVVAVGKPGRRLLS